MGEIKFLKGNEAVAYAAIRCGCDGYFGYPITPQTEIIETLMEMRPWEETGMVVLQAESEVASINMLYGGAAAGKRVMTSSSSPGISLMCEGISYLAGANLPCVIVDISRGGPGLGTIQPSQSDYFQIVKGGGHGDYRCIVLAPASVQEMHDFVFTAFDLAFQYRIPVFILADGIIGQMMEKVEIADQIPRLTEEEVFERYGEWAATGRRNGREHKTVTSLSLEAVKQEQTNILLQEKYAEITARESRFEEFMCDDADYIMVAYGSSARICMSSVEALRSEGIKVGVLRPITLYPFPAKELQRLAKTAKGFLSVEMSTGQMIEDVKLSIECSKPVYHYGRFGGSIHSPGEVTAAFKEHFCK